MNVSLTERALDALVAAPPMVQKAFIKQMNFLSRNRHHPSLHAKNNDWRFYFNIVDNAYIIRDIVPHPK
jgi:hypothetical protein